MADKEDKDDGKPSLGSNSLILTASQTSWTQPCISRPYGTMTSSTSTVARNIFASFSGSLSTDSRMYAVTSLPSDAFGASAFRSFESSGSFTTTSTSKSSGVQTGRKNPGYEQKYPSQSDHELRKTIAPYGPRSSTSSKANMVLIQSSSQSKVGPRVFGELPGNKSSVTCQSKEEKSMDSSVIETNVLPDAGHYSTPALFVTSGNTSASAPSRDSGLSTPSVPKSRSSSTITPTVFGDGISSVISPDVTTQQSRYGTLTTAQPSQEVLDSKVTSENLMPTITSESVLEGSNVVVSSQSSIATTLFGGTISKEQKKDDVVTESKSGEQEKEEPKSQVEHTSLKDPVSVAEPSSKHLEQEKQLEDLLSSKDLIDMLGKEEAKLTPASTPQPRPVVRRSMRRKK